VDLRLFFDHVLFLVAPGIGYNIFLMTGFAKRRRAEHGLKLSLKGARAWDHTPGACA
jgi:hypothetical protein